MIFGLAAYPGDITAFFVDDSASLREVIAVIDRGELQIALVVDAQRRLLGTVTDSDVRRAS